MKTYLDCYPCFLRQALEAARMAGADQSQQKKILDQALDLLARVDASSTPPEVGDRIHRLVRAEANNGDPYRKIKESHTRQALDFYPRMEALIAEADDVLDTALRLSIAGNIIDLGPDREYDLWETVERVLDQPFAIDDRAAFREALAGAEQVLYLADNAGETVFDRVLIEALDTHVTYGVKGGPILNDATREDAIAAGINEVTELVDNGSDAPGTILERCSEEFRQLYDAADMIIAKGQANYETLSDEGSKVFCLLQTKCPVIARDVGVPMESIVLKQCGA